MWLSLNSCSAAPSGFYITAFLAAIQKGERPQHHCVMDIWVLFCLHSIPGRHLAAYFMCTAPLYSLASYYRRSVRYRYKPHYTHAANSFTMTTELTYTACTVLVVATEAEPLLEYAHKSMHKLIIDKFQRL
jgi:hypothetical protein